MTADTLYTALYIGATIFSLGAGLLGVRGAMWLMRKPRAFDDTRPEGR